VGDTHCEYTYVVKVVGEQFDAVMSGNSIILTVDVTSVRMTLP
jgi:hypothetical protein